MDDPGIGEKLVKALDDGFPDNDRALRPVHTFGIGATGYFVASDAARDFCVAEHFQGNRIRVTVRFSNGSGSSVQHDGWSDVRGMATRFHIADNIATDLIAMTLGEFFTPTVETFLCFSEATKPVPVTRKSAWQKLCDMAQLIPPRRDPIPDRLPAPIRARSNSRINTRSLSFPCSRGECSVRPRAMLARLITQCIRSWSWRPTGPAAGFASPGNPWLGFSPPMTRRRLINICSRNCATASPKRPRASF